MAVTQSVRLKAAERRIADAVYKRLSREIGAKLSKGELILAPGRAGVGKTARVAGPTLARAVEVFGSKQVATRWLCRPNPALKLKAPLDVITSARGRKEVEAILGRIEQGVIS